MSRRKKKSDEAPEPMKERLLSVKIRDLIEVKVESPNQNGFPELITIRSPEAAPQSFYEAMSAMRFHLARLLDLPELYTRGLHVHELELRYDAEDPQATPAVIIRANKEIGGLSPFKIATPQTVYTSQGWSDIQKVCTEAISYFHGVRSQLSLFSQEASEDDQNKLAMEFGDEPTAPKAPRKPRASGSKKSSTPASKKGSARGRTKRTA